MRARISSLVAVCAMLAACGEKPDAPPPVRPVLSMVVTPVGARNINIVGTVQPRFSTDYGFRMIGRLIARPVDVGEIVKKDQTLAAVDAIAAELAVRASLAALTTAQGQAVNAAGTAERQRKLIETGATSNATVDSAEQANAAAQASVIRAQAELTKAREQLGYTKIKANYAGVVTAVGVQVGQIVAPGQTVVTVARPDVREAVIDVAANLAYSLRVGMPLTVALQLDPAIRAKGKIREIGPQSDSLTRLRRVRVTLEQPPDLFRLGSTVSVLIPEAPGGGIQLPATAVLNKDGKSYVWVFDPATQSVSTREVQAAPGVDGLVTVASGIAAGVRVITAGVHHLKNGQKVRLEQGPAT